MKEAIKGINERIAIKEQLFRYVESAESRFTGNARDEFKYRHQIIIQDLKDDVAELKRAKEKLLKDQ
ncbi:hypothetical protein QO206_03235 [Leeuwenhoekiella aequorea]|uniref:hypothetical protein n=1 Tax=Leeuwenhoekiella aequorea TaxID=283736 RepID=UPI00352CBF2C|tara:strand:+ start:7342 stop:7542 length:201 start_codon:yes stop_codon:yes gene_type:complete